MTSCCLCGNPKTSGKTYLIKTGKLVIEGINKQYMGQGIYKSTNIYDDIELSSYHVCPACRWKWRLLYPVILGLILSFLFGKLRIYFGP